jgi:hypothetical protein
MIFWPWGTGLRFWTMIFTRCSQYKCCHICTYIGIRNPCLHLSHVCFPRVGKGIRVWVTSIGLGLGVTVRMPLRARIVARVLPTIGVQTRDPGEFPRPHSRARRCGDSASGNGPSNPFPQGFRVWVCKPRSGGAVTVSAFVVRGNLEGGYIDPFLYQGDSTWRRVYLPRGRRSRNPPFWGVSLGFPCSGM